MAQCAQWAETSAGTVLVPASGDTCTGVVLVTPAEYAQLSTNPFRLTLEEGAFISSAVIGVWVIAVCIREIASVFSNDGNSTE